jgi:hypothetical protein
MRAMFLFLVSSRQLKYEPQTDVQSLVGLNPEEMGLRTLLLNMNLKLST